MGVVYKALHPALDKIVAVKTISAHLDAQPELRSRFLLEARAAAQLSHKNIITIYDYDEHKGRAYLVLEFLDGKDLKAEIFNRKPMSLEQKLRIMIEVCEGLAHAHKSGVIHRDVKPGNIFITRSGEVKIVDFGLARIVSSELTKSHHSMGTPAYMSPEQVKSQRVDHRSDIFSVGVVFYELLTYRKPFYGESDVAITYQILQSDPEAIENLDPRIPKELVAIVLKALAKQPEQRFQQMEELLRELEQFRNSLEERKRVLHQEAADAVARLERLIRDNRDLLPEAAAKLEEMKADAPTLLRLLAPAAENNDSARPPNRLDYLELQEMSERARHEYSRLNSLVERRKKVVTALGTAPPMRTEDNKPVESSAGEDLGETAFFLKELSARLDEQTLEQQQAGIVDELFRKATSKFAVDDLTGCLTALAELLSLQPDHMEATALLERAQLKIKERAELESKRRRADEALSAARRYTRAGNFEQARKELERALAVYPETPRAFEVKSEIDRAEEEHRARLERERQVNSLFERAGALHKAGNDADAVILLGQLLDLQPGHLGAQELQSEIEEESKARRRADELYHQAESQFASDEPAACLLALAQVLKLRPGHPAATELLDRANQKIKAQKEREERRRRAGEALAAARKAAASDEFARAREEVERARAIDPELQDVPEILAEIDRAEANYKARQQRERQVNRLFQEAKSLRDSGTDDEALDRVLELLALEPRHLPSLELKTEIEEARKARERQSRDRLERIAGALRRARQAEAAGDLEKAIELARTVLAEEEFHVEATEFIGRLEGTLVEREANDRRNRERVARLLDAARQAISAKRFQEAIETLDEISGIERGRPDVVDLRREALAASEAEKTSRVRHAKGQRQKTLGSRLLADKQFRDSLQAFRRAADLLGEDAEIQSGIEQAEAGIRAEEIEAQTRSEIAEINKLISTEALDEARKRALRLSPQNAETTTILGRIDQAQEQKHKRLEIARLLTQCREALTHHNFKEAALHADAVCILDPQNGEARELLKRINLALDEKRKRAEIARLLADCNQALSTQNFQISATLAREVLLLDPQNREAKQLLKRIEQAWNENRKQNEMDSILSQARHALQRRELEEAENRLRQALQLEPKNKEAKALLKEIKREKEKSGADRLGSYSLEPTTVARRTTFARFKLAAIWGVGALLFVIFAGRVISNLIDRPPPSVEPTKREETKSKTDQEEQSGWLEHAADLLKERRHSDAKTALEQGLRRWPDNQEAAQLLKKVNAIITAGDTYGPKAQTLFKQGQYDEALRILDQWLGDDPESPPAQKLRTRTREAQQLVTSYQSGMRDSNYEMASNALWRLEKLNPDDPESKNRRSDIDRTFSPPYTDHFLSLNPFWSAPQNWRLEKGKLLVRGPGIGLLRGKHYKDFTVNFDIRFVNRKGAIWIVPARDQNNYYLFQLSGPDGPQPNSFSSFRCINGKTAPAYPPVSVAADLGKPGDSFRITIEVTGGQIKHSMEIALDPKPTPRIIALNPFPTLGGTIGFGTRNDEQFLVSGLMIEPAKRKP
jgi:serine/threonine-protein kinase